MGALIIVMLWIGLNLSIEYFQKKKKVSKCAKLRRKPERIYDFDILTEDYTDLKKSA